MRNVVNMQGPLNTLGNFNTLPQSFHPLQAAWKKSAKLKGIWNLKMKGPTAFFDKTSKGLFAIVKTMDDPMLAS